MTAGAVRPKLFRTAPKRLSWRRICEVGRKIPLGAGSWNELESHRPESDRKSMRHLAGHPDIFQGVFERGALCFVLFQAIRQFVRSSIYPPLSWLAKPDTGSLLGQPCTPFAHILRDFSCSGS